MKPALHLPTRLLILGALAGAFAAPAAQAEEGDSLKLTLAETVGHDDNLFRLADGVDPTPLAGKSARGDSYHTELLGVSFDQQYSLQRLHLGASLANHRYRTYGFLNRQEKNFDGRWDWAVTPGLNGTLSAERSQALNSFSDITTYVQNIRTTDSVRASAEYGVLSAWRLTGGVGRIKAANSQVLAQTGDTETLAAEVGVKYVSTADNSIGYVLREHQVDWLNRPLDAVNRYDTGARQTDNEFRLDWRLSAKSRLAGALTHLRRHHDNFGDRDYRGTGGQLKFSWTPTAKTQLDVTAQREFSSWQETTATYSSSYTVTDRLAVSPLWRISEQTALRLRFEHADRDYRGPVVALPGPGRQDSYRIAQIGIDWAPWRRLTIAAFWRQEQRSSNQAGLGFADSVAAVTAQATF